MKKPAAQQRFQPTGEVDVVIDAHRGGEPLEQFRRRLVYVRDKRAPQAPGDPAGGGPAGRK